MAVNKIARAARRTHLLGATFPPFSRTLLKIAAAASVAGLAPALAGPILPAGGNVASGSATIGSPSNGNLTINQTSDKAIINWNGFSVGQGNSVTFDNGAGATLNRVTGNSQSNIDGSLSATGSVYLLNPQGVVIGPNGTVNVGKNFVASTLGVSDDAFNAGGNLTLSGTSTGAVVNEGKIGALGGDVALVARNVANAGAIAAPKGSVGLLAGTQVTVRDATLDDGKFSVDLSSSTDSAHNTGNIQAAEAELKANGGNVYALAGNMSGVIQATGVSSNDGKVFLTAGDSGSVTTNATISAQTSSGAGGTVETSGGKVNFDGLRVAAGEWIVDPVDLDIDAPAAATISANLANTDVYLKTTATGTNSSTSAGTIVNPGNGDINVNAAISWTSDHFLTVSAYRNININQSLTDTGAGGIDLFADNSATGIGTVTFSGGAKLMSGLSRVFYNPTSYATPTNYNADFVGPHRAFMLVNSMSQLQAISTNLGGTYALNANLDATGFAFTPIGSSATPFTGLINGRTFTISNLTINLPSTDDVGLFGAVVGSVNQINLVNANIVGRNDVSGVVGVSLGGAIQNSTVSGSVSGRSFVGGIVGDAQALGGHGTAVFHDSSSATVSDALAGGINDINFGGVAGAIEHLSTMTSAQFSGIVHGGISNVGGLAGYSDGTVTGGDAGGNVTAAVASTNIGGLVGKNDGAINTSTASAGVNVFGQIAGGLVGLNTGTITTSTASGGVAAGIMVGGLVGENEGVITLSSASGSASNVGFSGTNVIQFGGLVGFNSATGFISYSLASGDASGYSDVGGLVGENAGSIDHSGASGSATGIGIVGGFAGLNDAGAHIAESFATAVVAGGDSAIPATVTSAGGLAGDNAGDINNSWAGGAVSIFISSTSTARSQAGGLVGMNEATGTISYAYAIGNVTGSGVHLIAHGLDLYWGGLVGENAGSVNQAYATGTVLPLNAGNVPRGGLIGRQDSGASLHNAYLDGTTSGATWDVGTGFSNESNIGFVNASNGTAYSQASYGFFDFTPGTGHWFMIDGETRPFLQAETWSPDSTDYLIVNAHQLQLMAMLPGASYALAPNIVVDASATSASISAPSSNMWTARGFSPVGDNTTSFSGTLDGTGGTITNLYVSRPNQDYVGLFGLIGATGTAENVQISNANITGNNFMGVLAGWNNGTVDSVAVDGHVTGALIEVSGPTSGDTGGLIGHNDGSITGSEADVVVASGQGVGGLVGNNFGTILQSSASGSASGAQDSVGGLVGGNSGFIDQSHATASVSGSVFNVGGLAGLNTPPVGVPALVANAGTISNSYALGHVTGTYQNIGGLIGENDGTVATSYAAGQVSGTGTFTGGLIGKEQNGGQTSDSYWDTGRSGLSSSADGTGLTDAQMFDSTKFAGFDMSAMWYAAGTMPLLRSEYSTTITNAHQLQLMALDLTASYVLGKDVDATATGNQTDVWSSAGFIPVGGNGAADFIGVLDGQNHTISDLTSHDTTVIVNTNGTGIIHSDGNAGLFGTIGVDGIVENITLANATVTAGDSMSAGALAGWDFGKVINAASSGFIEVGNEISPTRESAGGLIGGVFGPSGSVTGSHSSATVVAGDSMDAGGLVGGLVLGGKITSSYATGNVTVGGDAAGDTGGGFGGGLVGIVFDTGGSQNTITNSYATGSVTATGQLASIGGFVGWMDGGGNLASSFATGNVTAEATKSAAGGFVGYMKSLSSVTTSFATGNVSTIDTSAGGGFAGEIAVSGTITKSYASGSTSVGTGSAGGGFLGFIDNGSTGTLTDDYALGGTTGPTASEIGGFIGFNPAGGNISYAYASGFVSGPAGATGGFAGINIGPISNAYFDTGTTGTTTGVGAGPGTGVTAIGGATGHDAYSAASYANLNDGNWVFLSGGLRPMLASEYSTTIMSAHQLQLMALHPSADYTLATFLDLSATQGGHDVWSTAGFVPVDNFTGAFNGNSNTLDNLFENRPSVSLQGLFRSIQQGGVVENVNIIAPNITGKNIVGALVGDNVGGAISNVLVAGGSVTGTRYIGGIAGSNEIGNSRAGTITGSFSSALVLGSADRVGGLVGWNQTGGILTDDIAEGHTVGADQVGGLVGWNDGKVTDSGVADSAEITASDYAAGGLVGYNTSNGTLNSVYATGIVDGTAGGVGGLVGYNKGSIALAYATGVVGNHSTRTVGGLVGNNEGSIATVYVAVVVQGATSATGALVGANAASSSITNAYYDTFITGAMPSIGNNYETGVDPHPMNATHPPTSPSTYVSFDFSPNGDWSIAPGQTPTLRHARAP